ncbi:MAG: hypothetical protein QXF43_05835 [Nitrososphaerales archaeon]
MAYRTNGGYCDSNCKYFECLKDADCTGYDPNTHTKMVCECPSGCTLTGSSYTCKPKGTCNFNSECDTNYCCDKEIGYSGACVSKGIYSDNPKYLCDPPEWVTVGTSKKNSQ